MRRYSVSFAASVSGSAATATNELGFITGTGRVCQIYEIILGNSGTVQDATVRSDIYRVSGITAGSTLTPTVLDSGGTAATTQCSSTPTGVTTVGLSLLPIAFNTRATVRWAAIDPDSRLSVDAGGTAAGSLVIQNQQPGVVSPIVILNQVFFAE